MAGRSRLLIVLSLTLLLFLLPVAAVPGEGESSFLREGKRLYTDLCSNCHGNVNDSAKAGRSMSRIRSALRTFDQHKAFATIPDEAILLISMALAEQEN